MAKGKIYCGIGGWTFEPWRGVFYPKGLAHARELEYASQHLSAIEVNGTFYGSIKADSFRRWHDETPAHFMFSLKAPRFAVNRKVLAEAGDSINRFFANGVTELKDKLGPILWQLAPFKRFDPEDLDAFLSLLPEKVAGRKIRHVLEVRHESFCVPEFIALARKHNVAIVLAEAAKFPLIADVTSDFVYLRLQKSEDIKTGYPPKALDAWAQRARAWAEGGEPKEMKPIAGPAPKAKARDVFAFIISGEKVRNPAAAMALMERVK